MAYTNIAPRTQNITGADLSGADGSTDRTYTIPDVGVLSSGLDIVISGTQLHEGASLDFTLSGETLTFLNAIDNTDVIRVNYFISLTGATSSSLTTSTSLRYATPLQLAAIIGIKEDVPSWDVGSTPSNETVGTGDDSETKFYLDHKNILSDSYTLYANAVEMTETTHYTLDSYITNGMSDDFLIAVLSRAEQELDKVLNTSFTDSTSSNPSYPTLDERHSSKGYFEQQYFTRAKPIIDVSGELASDITSSDTSLALATGQGDNFPSSGYILIGSEIIAYTGISTDTLTGCTRGQLESTAAAHLEDDEVHTSIMQVSGTSQGSAPVWNTLSFKSDFFVDDRKFFIYKDSIEGVGTASDNLLATIGVENRVRLLYLYGYDTIPVDITRLTLLYAKRQLITDNIGKAMIAGRNEFRPEMLNADLEEIERIKDTYIMLSMGNT